MPGPEGARPGPDEVGIDDTDSVVDPVAPEVAKPEEKSPTPPDPEQERQSSRRLELTRQVSSMRNSELFDGLTDTEDLIDIESLAHTQPITEAGNSTVAVASHEFMRDLIVRRIEGAVRYIAEVIRPRLSETRGTGTRPAKELADEIDNELEQARHNIDWEMGDLNSLFNFYVTQVQGHAQRITDRLAPNLDLPGPGDWNTWIREHPEDIEAESVASPETAEPKLERKSVAEPVKRLDKGAARAIAAGAMSTIDSLNRGWDILIKEIRALGKKKVDDEPVKLDEPREEPSETTETTPRVERQATEIDPEEIQMTMIDMYRRDVSADTEEQDRRGDLTNQQILEEMSREPEIYDALVSKAIAKTLINRELANVRKATYERQKQLEKKGVAKKLLAFLGTTYAGVLARHLIQQGLIGEAVKWAGTEATKETVLAAARGVSMWSGIAVGGAVGAGFGAYRARERAKRKQFEVTALLEAADSDEKLNLTPQERADLVRKLLVEKRFYGTSEAIEQAYTSIEETRQAQLANELRIVRDRQKAETADYENLTLEERLRLVAEALTQLYQTRMDESGSEATKTREIQAFIDGRQRVVNKETWKGAALGAVAGAVPAGIFGWFFPSSGLVTQINTEVVMRAPERLADMVSAFTGSSPDLALGDNMGVDLRHEYNGKQLATWAADYIKDAKANGVSTENIERGLHHLLSHAEAITKNWDQFQSIVHQHATDTGKDFTLSVIHGGANGLLVPFSDMGAGGELGKDMAHSMHSYVTHGFTRDTLNPSYLPYGDHLHKTINHMGFETPWFVSDPVPLIGAIGSSAGAKLSGSSESIKGAVDKLRNRKSEATKEQVKEKEKLGNRGPHETAEIEINPTIFVDPNENRDKLADLNNFVVHRHGYFVFKQDAVTGKMRAFRLWPMQTAKAKTWGDSPSGLPAANDPSMMNSGPENGLVPHDPNAVEFGEIYCHEVEFIDVYNSSRSIDHETYKPLDDQDQVANTWTSRRWKTPVGKVPTRISYQELTSDNKLVVIHPQDADKYAYLIHRDPSLVGQILGDNKPEALDDLIAKVDKAKKPEPTLEPEPESKDEIKADTDPNSLETADFTDIVEPKELKPGEILKHKSGIFLRVKDNLSDRITAYRFSKDDKRTGNELLWLDPQQIAHTILVTDFQIYRKEDPAPEPPKDDDSSAIEPEPDKRFESALYPNNQFRRIEQQDVDEGKIRPEAIIMNQQYGTKYKLIERQTVYDQNGNEVHTWRIGLLDPNDNFNELNSAKQPMYLLEQFNTNDYLLFEPLSETPPTLDKFVAENFEVNDDPRVYESKFVVRKDHNVYKLLTKKDDFWFVRILRDGRWQKSGDRITEDEIEAGKISLHKEQTPEVT